MVLKNFGLSHISQTTSHTYSLRTTLSHSPTASPSPSFNSTTSPSAGPCPTLNSNPIEISPPYQSQLQSYYSLSLYENPRPSTCVLLSFSLPVYSRLKSHL